MVRWLALLVGVLVGAVTTTLSFRFGPPLVSVELPGGGGLAPDRVRLALFVLGPLPGAATAGYLAGDRPLVGAGYGFAVSVAVACSGVLLFAAFLLVASLHEGLVSSDLLGGLGVAALVALVAVVVLVPMALAQVGGALAGAVGSQLRSRTRPRERHSER